MKRKRKLVLLSHCILNVNAKVEGIATSKSGITELVTSLMNRGYGIIQLPCEEQDMCGIRRWGQVEEQLNHPRFRKRCEELLEPVVMQVRDFVEHGYTVSAVIGLDGSPSCGVNETCSGEWYGEIGDGHNTMERASTLTSKKEPGVMMAVLKEMFEKVGLDIPFYAADETNPKRDTEILLEKICGTLEN